MNSKYPFSIQVSAVAVSQIVLGSFNRGGFSHEAEEILTFVTNTRTEYLENSKLLGPVDNRDPFQKAREARAHILSQIQQVSEIGSMKVDWLHALLHPRSNYMFVIKSANTDYVQSIEGQVE